jgi:cellulose synthase/poly-beta-1,6-N-acetylglucosamine synthase-like glycosyltransferase
MTTYAQIETGSSRALAIVPDEFRPLPQHLRADRVLSRGQAVVLTVLATSLAALVIARLALDFGPTFMQAARIALDIITVVNFLIIGYQVSLMVRALGYQPPKLTLDQLMAEPPGGWPTFTIIVPMYFEPAAVIRGLVEHLQALDYPADKVFVRFAVEQKDTATQAVIRAIELPPGFRMVVCPPRQPMGKPGACNHVLLTDAPGQKKPVKTILNTTIIEESEEAGGLAIEAESLSVVYDVEDIPDPLQLRKAAHAFAAAPPSVVCFQAQLQYHNVDTNALTRIFSSEYAYHFAIRLQGLCLAGAPIPLGGTSNFFRTSALLALGGWDMYNVTEDATLGITIYRKGWKVGMLDSVTTEPVGGHNREDASVTYEEANSSIPNWIAQRSRWQKGYIQTWLVHMRNPWRLWRELGTAGFMSFQLTLGFATFTTIINPLLWLLTTLYIVSRIAGWHSVSTGIESLFPPAIFYLGMLSMVVGNLMVVYFHLVGCMERHIPEAVFAVFLLPAYWLLMFVSACRAIGELLVSPHKWAHTQHGLVSAPDSHPANPTTLAQAVSE